MNLPITPLEVIERAPDGSPRPDGRRPQDRWRCRCACGAIVIVYGIHLRSGHTKSCGCHKAAVARARRLVHGESRRRIREYEAWQMAKARCFNPKATGYKYWGGRGITMCDRWRDSYESFLADMGRCPPRHSLDRWPNPDGNYEPGNCRWATAKQQAANKRPRVADAVATN